MSLLEQQLKELQTKKEKVRYFREALEALQLLNKPSEGDAPSVDAREQVIHDMTDFINSQIETIESGKETKTQQAQAETFMFSADEVSVLKAIVARAQNRVQAAEPSTNAQQPSAFGPDDGSQVNITKPNPRPPQKKGQDVLQFAMAHRHLDGKRVTITTRDGQVGGVVRGMMMPNIIVQTDTGHEAAVPPETLTVE